MKNLILAVTVSVIASLGLCSCGSAHGTMEKQFNYMKRYTLEYGYKECEGYLDVYYSDGSHKYWNTDRIFSDRQQLHDFLESIANRYLYSKNIDHTKGWITIEHPEAAEGPRTYNFNIKSDGDHE